MQANKMLDAVLKDTQRTKRELAVEHKQSVTDEDREQIKVYFADARSRMFMIYTWFAISSHFCLRGRELQARLGRKNLLIES